MPDRDRDVDVVVGAGGAGLAAALAARECGADVLLVEVAGRVGGSTALSSGSFMAAGTEMQRERELADDPDAFFDHYLTFNRWVCDPAVARRFCDDGWSTMQWLISQGVRYEASGLYRAGRESVPRSHRPHGGGQAVVDALAAAARGGRRRDRPRQPRGPVQSQRNSAFDPRMLSGFMWRRCHARSAV